MPRRKSLEEFLLIFKEVHADKYDYSLVPIIKNNTVKIPIICKTHNEIFWQTVNSHSCGRGCPKCGRASQSTKIIENKKLVFSTKASKKHNNKYTYERVKYTGLTNKISITCPEHGEFIQSPKDHLQGVGCTDCASYGYRKRDFVRKCKEDKATLYIIECFNEKERFIKIGITSKEDVEKRFKGELKMPYRYNILIKEVNSPIEVYNKEKELHRKFKIFKYKPLKKFSGSSECFNIGVKELL